jgi:hypothetical protein
LRRFLALVALLGLAQLARVQLVLVPPQVARQLAAELLVQLPVRQAVLTLLLRLLTHSLAVQQQQRELEQPLRELQLVQPPLAVVVLPELLLVVPVLLPLVQLVQRLGLAQVPARQWALWLIASCSCWWPCLAGTCCWLHLAMCIRRCRMHLGSWCASKMDCCHNRPCFPRSNSRGTDLRIRHLRVSAV